MRQRGSDFQGEEFENAMMSASVFLALMLEDPASGAQ